MEKFERKEKVEEDYPNRMRKDSKHIGEKWLVEV